MAPKGGAPNGGGPNGGGPKFRAFFPSPATVFILFSLFWSFSWNFGGVQSTGALKCARLEFSGCRVRAPAARSGGREREKKSENLGGPAEGGPAERP